MIFISLYTHIRIVAITHAIIIIPCAISYFLLLKNNNKIIFNKIVFNKNKMEDVTADRIRATISL